MSQPANRKESKDKLTRGIVYALVRIITILSQLYTQQLKSTWYNALYLYLQRNPKQHVYKVQDAITSP